MNIPTTRYIRVNKKPAEAGLEKLEIPISRHSSRSHVGFDNVASDFLILRDDNWSGDSRFCKREMITFLASNSKAVCFEYSYLSLPISGRELRHACAQSTSK
jgi:hypothetical protein